MSFAELEQTTTGINLKRTFIVESGLPFNRTSLLDRGDLEFGSVHAVISDHTKMKLMFRLTSGICANRNSENPYVQIDPSDLSFTEEKNPKKPDRHSRLMKLGVALVASIVEGFKPFVFTDINIAKSIEEISKPYKSGKVLVFTTLRIPTEIPNQLRYKIAVYSNEKRTSNYLILNILGFSITRSPESISIEIDRDKASDSDTIAIRAIMEKVLGLLEDNIYIDGTDSLIYDKPGKWDFDNYRN